MCITSDCFPLKSRALYYSNATPSHYAQPLTLSIQFISSLHCRRSLSAPFQPVFLYILCSPMAFLPLLCIFCWLSYSTIGIFVGFVSMFTMIPRAVVTPALDMSRILAYHTPHTTDRLPMRTSHRSQCVANAGHSMRPETEVYDVYEVCAVTVVMFRYASCDRNGYCNAFRTTKA